MDVHPYDLGPQPGWLVRICQITRLRDPLRRPQMQICQVKLGEVGVRLVVGRQQVVGERGDIDTEGVEVVEREEVYAKGEEAGEEAGEVFKGVGGDYPAFPHVGVGDVEEVTFWGEKEQVVDDVRGESEVCVRVSISISGYRYERETDTFRDYACLYVLSVEIV
jgi:hypothetical protein